MDPKASPCDDFYEYACGNWINKKQINEDQTGITQFGTLRDELNKKLKGLFNQLALIERIYFGDLLCVNIVCLLTTIC